MLSICAIHDQYNIRYFLSLNFELILDITQFPILSRADCSVTLPLHFPADQHLRLYPASCCAAFKLCPSINVNAQSIPASRLSGKWSSSVMEWSTTPFPIHWTVVWKSLDKSTGAPSSDSCFLVCTCLYEPYKQGIIAVSHWWYQQLMAWKCNNNTSCYWWICLTIFQRLLSRITNWDASPEAEISELGQCMSLSPCSLLLSSGTHFHPDSQNGPAVSLADTGVAHMLTKTNLSFCLLRDVSILTDKDISWRAEFFICSWKLACSHRSLLLKTVQADWGFWS